MPMGWMEGSCHRDPSHRATSDLDTPDLARCFQAAHDRNVSPCFLASVSGAQRYFNSLIMRRFCLTNLGTVRPLPCMFVAALMIELRVAYRFMFWLSNCRIICKLQRRAYIH